MIFRYVFSMGSGTVITLAIFYLMQGLIDMNADVDVTPRKRHILDFVRVPENEDLIVDALQPPPQRIDEPPELPPMSRPDAENGTLTVPAMPVPETPTGNGGWAPGNVLDSLLVAVLRVAPQYPPEMATRGLEGYVVVQFDVTEAGSVTNVRIVESSHRGFEKAAKRAAARFRFQPKVVDGVAMPVRNVMNRFVFRLDRA